jgi:hypothetical protein
VRALIAPGISVLHRRYDRWIMMFFIGMTIGVVGYSLYGVRDPHHHPAMW